MNFDASDDTALQRGVCVHERNRLMLSTVTQRTRELHASRSCTVDCHALLCTPSEREELAHQRPARQEIQQEQDAGEAPREPPILEWIVALFYKVTGGESFWLPRILSVILWLLGALCIFRISREYTSFEGSLTSLFLYLFLPYGIPASRAFMPDPGMIAAILFALLFIVRYHRLGVRRYFWLSIILSSFAGVLKPFSLMFLIPSFLLLNIHHHGIKSKKFVLDCTLYLLAVSALSIPYYIYGLFFSGFLRGYASQNISPHLLLSPAFWGGWLDFIRITMGYLPFIVSLFGIIFASGSFRYLLGSLWIGYLAYCMTFSYSAHKQDYYHLILIPIVALNLAPIGELIFTGFRSFIKNNTFRIGIAAIAFFSVVVCVHEARSRWKTVEDLTRSEVEMAVEIGKQLKHNSNVIMLARFYSRPLKYHGEISGPDWPYTYDYLAAKIVGLKSLSVAERFNRIRSSQTPEYFVVGDLEEFERQQDLKMYLEANYPIIRETESYIIFGLTNQ